MSAAHAVAAATAASARAGAGGRAATFVESLLTRAYSMMIPYWISLAAMPRLARKACLTGRRPRRPAPAVSIAHHRTRGRGHRAPDE